MLAHFWDVALCQIPLAKCISCKVPLLDSLPFTKLDNPAVFPYAAPSVQMRKNCIQCIPSCRQRRHRRAVSHVCMLSLRRWRCHWRVILRKFLSLASGQLHAQTSALQFEAFGSDGSGFSCWQCYDVCYHSRYQLLTRHRSMLLRHTSKGTPAILLELPCLWQALTCLICSGFPLLQALLNPGGVADRCLVPKEKRPTSTKEPQTALCHGNEQKQVRVKGRFLWGVPGLTLFYMSVCVRQHENESNKHTHTHTLHNMKPGTISVTLKTGCQTRTNTTTREHTHTHTHTSAGL